MNRRATSTRTRATGSLTSCANFAASETPRSSSRRTIPASPPARRGSCRCSMARSRARHFLRLVFRAARCQTPAMEIVFSVTQEADGGFVAECLSQDIFTQGDTWEDLRRNVREAVDGFFFDQPKPERLRLHLVRDEVLTAS